MPAPGPAAAALRELLSRHPSALVASLGPEGILGPAPPALADHDRHHDLHGETGLDLVTPEDQLAVLDAWRRADDEAVVTIDVRLRGDTEGWARVHFFDVREEHGCRVVVLETDDQDLAARAAEVRDAERVVTARVERDATAVFTAVDPATTRLLGWAPEQMIGRRTLDFVHPDDVERGLENWMAMRAGVGTSRIRLRYRHASGHYLWLEVSNDNQLDDPSVGCVRSELVDVSAEMAQLEALREREHLLARLAEALPIGVCHLRTDNEVAYVNPPLVALLGAVDSRSALVRSVAADDRALVAAAIDAALDGRSTSLEVDVPRDGDVRRCELSLRPMSDEESPVDGVIVCAADVTDRSRLRAELEHRASHDDLTGCMNRAATLRVLEESLQVVPLLAVAFIDLDDFKRVNDELGHAAGDELLRAAARSLRRVTRGDDQVGRVGGDEFAVICPLVHADIEVADLAERLRQAVNRDVVVGGRAVPLRASVGIALSRPGERDGEAVLRRADEAMYEVKRRSADTRAAHRARLGA